MYALSSISPPLPMEKVLWKGTRGGPDTVTETSPLPQGLSVTVGSLPTTRYKELWLSVPEFGENERNYYSKVIQV